MKRLLPEGVHPPFARYVHGVEIPPGWRLVRTSGQLGVEENGDIPEDAFAQARLCFRNISATLQAAVMNANDIFYVSAYVTDRAYMAAYMKARDEFVAAVSSPPSSTLMIVSGFTLEAFKVEVEVWAASP